MQAGVKNLKSIYDDCYTISDSIPDSILIKTILGPSY